MSAANLPVRNITPSELKKRLEVEKDLVLIDVRESHEREICHIGGVLIPKDTVFDRVAEIPRDREVVVYCRSGGRSGWVVQELQNRYGFSNLINLAGGVLRWSDEIDPTVTKY